MDLFKSQKHKHKIRRRTKHAQTRIFHNEVKKGLYRDIDENY